MEQINNLCTAANLLVDSESSFCYNDRTNKYMDLVAKLDSKDVLIDVTTIGANNPSNGLLRTRKFHHRTFLGPRRL